MQLSFSPLALAIVLVAGLIIIAGPKRYVLPALLLIGLFIPMQNRVVFFSLDFMAHRLIVLFGWTRLLLRGEYRGISFNSIDLVMVLLTLWGVAAYTLLWGTFDAFVYRLGGAFDMVGLYFLFRALLRSWEDVERAARALGVVACLLAALMFIEYLTHKNPAAIIGGITEEVWIRKGNVRCRVAFGHAISAGIFGASLVPLWLATRRQRKPLKKWGVLGLGASTLITLTSASSSSVLTYAASLGGFVLWPLRYNLRLIRWSVIGMLVSLHLVMKAPVWALFARANIVGGSTGYHRYRLFDHYVNRFGEWWMLGVKDTEQWGEGLWDVTNQYVLEGVRGGVLRLGLFLLLLALCFREIGRALRRPDADRRRLLLVWSFGVMLFAQCVAFWGVDYWDQIIVPWYLLLALIAGLRKISLGEPDPATEPVVPEAAPEPVPAPG